jgi:carbonic anhydrase/acetyltransferase-like protein (isoleucine patch superfamily)
MIYEFNGFKPVISAQAYVHDTAVIIGNVIIGDDVYIVPGAETGGRLKLRKAPMFKKTV